MPVKIFEIKEEIDLGLATWKLKDFHEEEHYETENREPINLITEILDLKSKDGSIAGVFSKDFIRKRFYRRNPVETPVTEEAPFWITPIKDRIFVTVLAPSVPRGVKKLLTNYVANKLSNILFVRSKGIVEGRISHASLKQLHESNPQATKLIWFDEVDIPGVEKLCLAGSDLADTELYQDYLKHGKIWYVVFEVQKREFVVGITRSSVVTLFSRSTREDFINYITEDLLVLIE